MQWRRRRRATCNMMSWNFASTVYIVWSVCVLNAGSHDYEDGAPAPRASSSDTCVAPCATSTATQRSPSGTDLARRFHTRPVAISCRHTATYTTTLHGDG